ncbi:uncharacterized protein N7498_002544 [Penicillium cinerascens]|uniref:Uncharacterized protein n=1 Tax=Penicillium cinerascens TaxID=70096 RepID=A0A9W9TB00_9EURO|nr:uncharacterized protein N7498_002544 [Penicillium cinerascens]KAJ5216137.1 hypothetical protein N7498_002544 [Penicillium cinerascens]
MPCRLKSGRAATTLADKHTTVTPESIMAYAETENNQTVLLEVITDLADVFAEKEGCADARDLMRIPSRMIGKTRKWSPKIHPLSNPDRQAMDEQLDKLHNQSRMMWSNQATPFGAPVFVVKPTMPDGSNSSLVVVAVRNLNTWTVRDSYPLLRQEDTIKLTYHNANDLSMASIMDTNTRPFHFDGFYHDPPLPILSDHIVDIEQFSGVCWHQQLGSCPVTDTEHCRNATLQRQRNTPGPSPFSSRFQLRSKWSTTTDTTLRARITTALHGLRSSHPRWEQARQRDMQPGDIDLGNVTLLSGRPVAALQVLNSKGEWKWVRAWTGGSQSTGSTLLSRAA